MHKSYKSTACGATNLAASQRQADVCHATAYMHMAGIVSSKRPVKQCSNHNLQWRVQLYGLTLTLVSSAARGATTVLEEGLRPTNPVVERCASIVAIVSPVRAG